MKVKKWCAKCSNVFKVDFRWLGESKFDKIDMDRNWCEECINKMKALFDIPETEFISDDLCK